jgi:dipeptidyl aminopeptidase/acylaminoacyl peptidase
MRALNAVLRPFPPRSAHPEPRPGSQPPAPRLPVLQHRRTAAPLRTLPLLALTALLLPTSASPQGTRSDYLRADSFAAKTRGLVVDVAEAPNWIGETSRFWYRKSVKGGHAFVLVNPLVPEKGPAFHHEGLAASLASLPSFQEDSVTAVNLPFTRFIFVEDGTALEFEAADSTWRCGLVEYACENLGPVARRPQQPDPTSGAPWQAGPGQLWRNVSSRPVPSPDGAWEAFIQNHNVAVRKVGEEGYTLLSWDGSEGNTYTDRSMVWSPDSRRLAAHRVVPGQPREIHFIASSPEDQIQPRHSTLLYAKPGDVLDKEIPVIFHVETGERMVVDDALFPNPYTLSRMEWREDSRRLTFEYNQRGHQVHRVIEVDAATGTARALISEEPKTFFSYSGKRFRRDVDDGREIVWMSERDGWNHLYLYDGVTGRVKNQITRGEWVVRTVDSVDTEQRQIWFQASGMIPGQDPYFSHTYRINFDGTGLVAYTEADGSHSVDFSPDREFYVDRWSRVDRPPVAELRRTADGSLVMELERADASALLATGWQYPEALAAKGRDGVTDIWGIIIRPTNFDPGRRYPVIENIYAGPHSSFVPKTFSSQAGMQALAELGFIVVQIDGMGTSNRSKAFHDVAWMNIKDAGFPDRILWHRAVAARYPWYDIEKVGIYGGSAGGQNAMAALLFHPDFYHAAVSFAGCHDNRMDKIWWNEQWMGWPLGPQYSASSNVENAHLLQGKLLLVVGELDTNVDPASTLQVVNALIKADKDFDLLVIPGEDHGAGRSGPTASYGNRKRNDFFVRHLLGAEPPPWR